MKQPDEEFMYVDIGNIDTQRGVPNPVIMQGKDAKSSRMRRVMYAGTILVSTTRPTRNAIAMVPRELDNQICSTGFVVLRCKEGMDAKFIFHALRSKLSNLQFERHCSGSGYPAINQEVDLPKIRVPKPSDNEQQNIIQNVGVIESQAIDLENTARSIRRETELILLKELEIDVSKEDTSNYFFKSGTEKRSLYFFIFPQEMANRINYLFYHPRHEILNQLKEKYKIVPLEKCCEEPIHRGEQPEYDEKGDVIVIKTVNLKNSYIDYENCLKISQDFFDKFPLANIKKGDILVASTGYVSMGKVDVYDRSESAIVDGHISILRLKGEYDPYFVTYFLRSHLGQIQFEKWFSGSSGQIEIPPEDLNQFILPRSSEDGVPLQKQKEIAREITKRLKKSFELEEKAKTKWQEARDTFEKLILKEK